MDYFLLLKEVKENTPEKEFEKNMMEVRRLISISIREFIFKGVCNVFRSMEERYPMAIDALVRSISPFVERVYFLKCESNICRTFILPVNDDRRFNKEKIEDNIKVINDVIRAFVNGSKSYYLITNQEKLLRDLINETIEEIDLIINNKIALVFDTPKREFEVTLGVINSIKGF